MGVIGIVCDIVTGEMYYQYERAMNQLLAYDIDLGAYEELVRMLAEPADSLTDMAVRALPIVRLAAEKNTEFVGISARQPARIPFCNCRTRWHTAATGT